MGSTNLIFTRETKTKDIRLLPSRFVEQTCFLFPVFSSNVLSTKSKVSYFLVFIQSFFSYVYATLEWSSISLKLALQSAQPFSKVDAI